LIIVRINSSVLFIVLATGLLTSIYTYAGVTADGTTAFRWDLVQGTVIFTDNPSDDPDIPAAPLGSGWARPDAIVWTQGGTCVSNDLAILESLLCSGNSGVPIENYTCAPGESAVNPSNTFWCLFSENPQIENKAWAIKFVNGVIPSNDAASIVRCQGTDIFDSENGCQSPPPEISIEVGYIKLDTTEGTPPLNADCISGVHDGRIVIDNINDILYICTQSGWVVK